ncbi:disulfide bond formation protein DsbA [Halobacteriales archaeon SW_5_70_135]|nr:MAG: disulfide bond formation protein DsbA [Halobacteriales archaeon SW_5_70_135]
MSDSAGETETDDGRERLVVYSDHVCPFCYLGRTSLAGYRAERDDPLDVGWHPYDLRGHKRGPDGEIDDSVEDGKDETYFDQVRENVARLREEYDAGEMLSIDDVPTVDSLDAQRVSLHVREERPAAWATLDDALFEALWVDGRDVGDPEVLADVVASVGLPAGVAREALDDESTRERLLDQFAAARRYGVTGVPTFVYGDHAARGAVPPAHLRRLVEGV